MESWALSIAMFAAIALIIGAVFLWQRAERGKAVLMVLAALVLIGNVAIWTV